MARRIQRAIAYIDANLHRHIEIDELAGAAAMSKFHFARRFKRSIGRTPKQCVARRRLEVAKALLLAGEMPLVEVAHTCGYASQSHMNTVFRRLLGVTPGEYRREVVQSRDLMLPVSNKNAGAMCEHKSRMKN